MHNCYSNGVPTVETLRKSGHKVRVYHGRCFRTGQVMSKKEFTTLYGTTTVNVVNDRGGFTCVEVTSPNGVCGVGKYNFNNRQFNRKIGLQAAIGRALEHVNVVNNTGANRDYEASNIN